jgi:hypothetical protein
MLTILMVECSARQSGICGMMTAAIWTFVRNSSEFFWEIIVISHLLVEISLCYARVVERLTFWWGWHAE